MANQTTVTTTRVHSPLFFSKVSSGPGDSQLLFKLIYFWKTRNNSKRGILLGLEMLMIDEEFTDDHIMVGWMVGFSNVPLEDFLEDCTGKSSSRTLLKLISYRSENRVKPIDLTFFVVFY
ncbi:hypothetical protein YC2023_083750 [Brassica napus]